MVVAIAMASFGPFLAWTGSGIRGFVNAKTAGFSEDTESTFLLFGINGWFLSLLLRVAGTAVFP